MNPKEEKLRRLAYIAQRYYLEDQKQSDIARELGISRPLVSRLLQEARDLGVVEIRVHHPGEGTQVLLERLERRCKIQGGVLVPESDDGSRSNHRLVQGILEMLRQLHPRRLGIGWGHLIGELVTELEAEAPVSTSVEHICPLLGNAGIPIRNYHSNENVRVLADRMGARPHFLYLPALAESYEEKQLLCSTELYRQVEAQWERMDCVLLNIGNYPSTPDFASQARYGSLLQQKHACGRLLAYFFNQQGEVIHSDRDFAIQVPLETLAACPRVIGICSANTSPRALEGALRTGLVTHLVAGQELVRCVLDSWPDNETVF